jgi:hypothetical protein
MFKSKLKEKYFNSLLLGLVIFSVFIAPACKSPTSPNGEGEADIVVLNEYGEPLNIFLDQNFVCTLHFKSNFEIDNVSFGFHDLEARTVDADAIVDAMTLDIEANTDYEWEIDDPADINLKNYSGETVKVYMDDEYVYFSTINTNMDSRGMWDDDSTELDWANEMVMTGYWQLR